MTLPQANRKAPTRGRFVGERETGYGWISIVLHWATAAIVFGLLFIGDSISQSGPATRHLHVTVAASAWLFLAFRIVWRLWQGHPPPQSGRWTVSCRTAWLLHYVMLAAIAMMLISGPLAAWAGGWGIDVFQWRMPGSTTPNTRVAIFARALHSWGAATLAIGVTIHIAGAIKHIFVDRDGSFDRIMAPSSRGKPDVPD